MQDTKTLVDQIQASDIIKSLDSSLAEAVMKNLRKLDENSLPSISTLSHPEDSSNSSSLNINSNTNNTNININYNGFMEVLLSKREKDAMSELRKKLVDLLTIEKVNFTMPKVGVVNMCMCICV